jgi:nitrogenase molybdenum-cofactor synthesis protein NifE
MTHLARLMEQRYGIPFIRVSYFGLEDVSQALYDVAQRFSAEPAILARTKELVREEMQRVYPQLQAMKPALSGKEGGYLCGRRFQGILSYQSAQIPWYGDRPGWLADR